MTFNEAGYEVYGRWWPLWRAVLIVCLCAAVYCGWRGI